jgi:hypothetical protein
MHQRYFITFILLFCLSGFLSGQDVIITTPEPPDEIEEPEGHYNIATTGWFHDSLSA